jgi:hypothetical protein
MKTPSYQISIVIAAAIGTLTLILTTSQAEPPKRFGGLGIPNGMRPN